MTTVLIIVHILIVVALIGVVLLQKSEGGALGIGGGGSGGGFMTARGTANLLTRMTAILAGLFFVSTIILALHFKGSHTSKSILEDDANSPVSSTSQPAPAKEAPKSEPAVPVTQ